MAKSAKGISPKSISKKLSTKNTSKWDQLKIISKKKPTEQISGEVAEENESYRTKQFGNETGAGLDILAMARVLWRDVYFFDRRLHGIDRLG